jgi:energy-coupling factor transporter ATP-binding protein EcfA2
MTNNDILKKLRVALMLRDDEIVEILKLVDFRISKSEIGAFCRKEGHPKYRECGDQVLRNFLNGLVIHLRGTKEAPKIPMEVLGKSKEVKKSPGTKPRQGKFTGLGSVKYRNKKKS